jgi:hypothetical protein
MGLPKISISILSAALQRVFVVRESVKLSLLLHVGRDWGGLWRFNGFLLREHQINVAHVFRAAHVRLVRWLDALFAKISPVNVPEECVAFQIFAIT